MKENDTETAGNLFRRSWLRIDAACLSIARRTVLRIEVRESKVSRVVRDRE